MTNISQLIGLKQFYEFTRVLFYEDVSV